MFGVVTRLWRRGGLVVQVRWTSDLEVGGSSLKSLPSCCFLRHETLFHIVFLHSGLKMSTGDHNDGGNLSMD